MINYSVAEPERSSGHLGGGGGGSRRDDYNDDYYDEPPRPRGKVLKVVNLHCLICLITILLTSKQADIGIAGMGVET